MKIRISDAYLAQLKVRINSLTAAAKSFDWDQLGGQESALNWYDAFKQGCWDIERHGRITGDTDSYANSLVLLKSAMKAGRLRWTEIVECGF